MTVADETVAKVLRLFHAERWRVGTIARQLGIHHTTVARILRSAGIPDASLESRPSITDPYVALVISTLESYPTVPASRLFVMARERGYPGTSEGHFRRLVARHRPRKAAEAFRRLRTLPGEQAQVDWGHFGRIRFGSAERYLSAFVMVLSWSRRIFLRFFPSQTMPDFLRGHAAAFDAFGGVPRVLLYDNLKSAVLERQGDVIRFHPTLLHLAGHYRFEARPVAVARGNEKGRVERAIRYIRDSFFAARRFDGLDDLNAQATVWCEGLATERRWPQDHSRTVNEAFAEEQPKLLPLPDDAFPADDCVEVSVGKTPYVRFDRNDYSVPHRLVRQVLTVRATPTVVRILDGAAVITSHPRTYDQRQQVEDPEHIAELVRAKRAARDHRGKDRLRRAVPQAEALLIGAAERGHNLGAMTTSLLRLLDRYGPVEMAHAVTEALARGVPHQNAVRQCLERRRQDRALAPVVGVRLPDDPRVRELTVKPHALAGYDALKDEESC